MPLQLTSDIERPCASEARASSDYECLGGPEVCPSRDLERQVATVREVGVRGFPFGVISSPGAMGWVCGYWKNFSAAVLCAPPLKNTTKGQHIVKILLKSMIFN